ncbi:MAG: hypothetical protein ABGW99_09715 [Zunongwangia sp.]|jgi:hypothetical protein|uniref:hypothetical protein n=1 Tax=Zunongwangia sp. TaxID=1965325 RepID=UPI003242E690
MQKIEKHNGFFRKHYYRLFGLFYLIVAVAMFFTGESSSLMSYGYFAIGICYFVVQYFFGGSTEEYISWDEDKIVLKHWCQKEVSYNLSEVDHLNVSDYNLTIKKGVAAGTMIELKGFKPKDIQKLKQDFNLETNLQFA